MELVTSSSFVVVILAELETVMVPFDLGVVFA